MLEEGWKGSLGEGATHHLALGNPSGSHLVDDRTRGHHADQQVGDDQADQHREEHQPDPSALETVAEELYLRPISVGLAQFPDLYPEQEETERMDDATGTGQHSVDADPFLERLAGRTNQSESGHGGTEDRHQQQKWADGMAGQHVVLAGPPKQAAGPDAQQQQKPEVPTDDQELGHALSSIVGEGVVSSTGQQKRVARYQVPAAASEMPAW